MSASRGAAPERAGTGQVGAAPAREQAVVARTVPPARERGARIPAEGSPGAGGAPGTAQHSAAPRIEAPRVEGPRIEPAAPRPAAPPKERLVLLALALASAVLVLVMLLRREGPDAGAVQAQGAAPAAANPPPVPPPVAGAAPVAEVARTPHDAALHDPRNRYTVRLIQYANDEKGLALSLEAYRWLQQSGLPVGSPIRLGSGKGIVLVASAKPTQEELVPLRDYLRRLRYPESSKTMPFSTAFIDEIDDVLAR
ncbi:MAG: hypothetical protein JNK02_05565 [Planctomycetes bacterium]|nr:hypothetical protein [Planctomycetota bacterium]